MVNTLARLKSTLSTVTSTLQAVREFPGAVKEVVEFARENNPTTSEALRANNLVKNLATALEIDMSLNDERDKLRAEVKLLNDTLCDLQTEYSKELVAHKETERELNAANGEWGSIAREREDLRAKLASYEELETTVKHLKSALNRDRTGLALALCNIREHVNGCKWIPDGENASYSYDEMSEETIRKEYGYIIASVDQIAEKALLESGALATAAVRDELTEQFETMKTKLARCEAAETWHQLTDGEGELPPEGVDVICRLAPTSTPYIGKPCQGYGTFEWRFLSSKDVPQ